ncbi:LON peptidase substrate-binding domain-containing protein [Granulicoccus phenolivorans]|uniref:LON peptidase substrate-binding domain-containing protein n=1 Tax=Granulicoccus phenolivorans TaxID=266854 RepID=UPI000414EEEE|nr:LON peptidase substrate-binding domain-containing protein [Granulicoccus phenolivorans]
MSADRYLPLFPLGQVHFPEVPLQLRLFEPRYLTLLEDLLALPEPERTFGVVAIRVGQEVGDQPTDLFRVGCAVRLVDVADGLNHARITAMGLWRFRITEFLDDPQVPYRTASVERLSDPSGAPEAALHEAAAQVRNALFEYAAAMGGRIPEIEAEPAQLAYAVAGAFPLPVATRQALLEEPSTYRRLVSLVKLLRRETDLVHNTGTVAYQPPPDQSLN